MIEYSLLQVHCLVFVLVFRMEVNIVLFHSYDTVAFSIRLPTTTGLQCLSISLHRTILTINILLDMLFKRGSAGLGHLEHRLPYDMLWPFEHATCWLGVTPLPLQHYFSHWCMASNIGLCQLPDAPEHFRSLPTGTPV